MSLQPLLSAAPIIQLHTVAALLALLLGPVQFALPKGTILHRVAGYGWVAGMFLVAASSLWIHTIHVWGIWSPIHLLSLLVLITVPLGVWHARRGEIAAHRRTMVRLFALGLIGAGVFTLWPGRIMHAVLFGG